MEPTTYLRYHVAVRTHIQQNCQIHPTSTELMTGIGTNPQHWDLYIPQGCSIYNYYLYMCMLYAHIHQQIAFDETYVYMYSFFRCSNQIHVFIFSLLGLNPVELHLTADLRARFLRQDFSSARVQEAPARYMYIIQPLIPAINLKHKVLCQRQNIPHRSEAAGGAA